MRTNEFGAALVVGVEQHDDRVGAVCEREEDGSTWVVAVAESLAQLNADRQDLRQSLGAAFALVALIGPTARMSRKNKR